MLTDAQRIKLAEMAGLEYEITDDGERWLTRGTKYIHISAYIPHKREGAAQLGEVILSLTDGELGGLKDISFEEYRFDRKHPSEEVLDFTKWVFENPLEVCKVILRVRGEK